METRRAGDEEDHGVEAADSRFDEGYLLLADISGYTAFVAGVQAAHGDEIATGGRVPEAYPLLGSLLELTVRRLVPPFSLAKLEGDAVFAHAPTDAIRDGRTLVELLAIAQDDFRRHADDVEARLDCGCDQCHGIGDLRLKFLVHHGRFFVESIAGGEELVGADVTLVHRLAKNSVQEETGHAAYVLVTDAAAARLGGVPTASGVHEETYEHLPTVRARVVPLDAGDTASPERAEAGNEAR